ncbi:hypothetical protein BN1013_01560 [Candidatus Rubidus massiliensis]|nr:hypothetical protein BN1013_01560 [Candidatus Rubidus massiliensis]
MASSSPFAPSPSDPIFTSSSTTPTTPYYELQANSEIQRIPLIINELSTIFSNNQLDSDPNALAESYEFKQIIETEISKLNDEIDHKLIISKIYTFITNFFNELNARTPIFVDQSTPFFNQHFEKTLYHLHTSENIEDLSQNFSALMVTNPKLLESFLLHTQNVHVVGLLQNLYFTYETKEEKYQFISQMTQTEGIATKYKELIHQLIIDYVQNYSCEEIIPIIENINDKLIKTDCFIQAIKINLANKNYQIVEQLRQKLNNTIFYFDLLLIVANSYKSEKFAQIALDYLEEFYKVPYQANWQQDFYQIAIMGAIYNQKNLKKNFVRQVQTYYPPSILFGMMASVTNTSEFYYVLNLGMEITRDSRTINKDDWMNGFAKSFEYLPTNKYLIFYDFFAWVKQRKYFTEEFSGLLSKLASDFFSCSYKDMFKLKDIDIELKYDDKDILKLMNLFENISFANKENIKEEIIDLVIDLLNESHRKVSMDTVEKIILNKLSYRVTFANYSTFIKLLTQVDRINDPMKRKYHKKNIIDRLYALVPYEFRFQYRENSGHSENNDFLNYALTIETIANREHINLA